MKPDTTAPDSLGKLALFDPDTAAMVRSDIDAHQPDASPEAMALAERARLHIDRWFYPCSHAMHEGLGRMYVQDPRFERQGADLWRNEVLEVADAVLGTHRQVPTLHGTVEVTIPAGTQPDEILRLRNKGLPVYGSDRHGNLNIRIEVHIPEHPTRRERQLYEQLRALGEARGRTWHR